MSELIKAQTQRLIGLAKGSLQKEVADLTEDERCAIAWCAGVEMVTSEPDYTTDSVRVRYSTKNPIGIVKIDGKFRVYELVPTEDERLRKMGMLHFED